MKKRRPAIRSVAYLIAGIALIVLAVWYALTTPPFKLPTGATSAYQLDENYELKPDPNQPHIGRWRQLDQAQSLSREQIDRVRNLLGSHSTYGTTSYACFNPGIAFRFGEGANIVYVLICLHCHLVEYRSGDKSRTIPLSDSGIEEFRALLNEIFPDADAKQKEADRMHAKQQAELEAEWKPTSSPATSF